MNRSERTGKYKRIDSSQFDIYSRRKSELQVLMFFIGPTMSLDPQLSLDPIASTNRAHALSALSCLHSLHAFGHPDGCCSTLPLDDCCYRAQSRIANIPVPTPKQTPVNSPGASVYSLAPVGTRLFVNVKIRWHPLAPVYSLAPVGTRWHTGLQGPLAAVDTYMCICVRVYFIYYSHSTPPHPNPAHPTPHLTSPTNLKSRIAGYQPSSARPLPPPSPTHIYPDSQISKILLESHDPSPPIDGDRSKQSNSFVFSLCAITIEKHSSRQYTFRLEHRADHPSRV